MRLQMEGDEQQSKSRVVYIDTIQAWESYVQQATNEGCPAVVHFSASWCMPSVVMNPVMEELASNFQEVLFLNVDVDDVKDVASRMEIKAMPTFLLMKDGAAIDKLVGANPDEIRKWIDTLVQSTHVHKA
ncbi:hypothetical protein SAY87_008804 [Trapa incisa]|uniref:Thioredoxin domain-containing protein n=1 Tax=Trapa incisa TaxID=236973 RepID=A0AAN7JXT3_9MYRT|nr:hypothetical protein SAY87_008804 [Trapa incisa]